MPIAFFAGRTDYLAMPAERGAANAAVLGDNPSRLAVLIVDDERLIRWSLKRGLMKRGHDVVEAQSAADAIRAIGDDPDRFDVVILDFKLPDRQDLSLLADVRQLLPAAAIIMMTAYGDDSMRSGALALGARAVLDKPFQVNHVIALVESSAVH